MAPSGTPACFRLNTRARRRGGVCAAIRWLPPGVTGPALGTEINIVATMGGRKPRPEDAPPALGHVRITVDEIGLAMHPMQYETQTRVNKS